MLAINQPLRFLFVFALFIHFSFMNEFCPWETECCQKQDAKATTNDEATTTPIQCSDAPHVECTLDKCRIEPGIYLPKCKLTCNNCNGCRCEDNIVSCNLLFGTNKDNCKKDSVSALKYCPKFCELCANIQTARCVPDQ